MLRPYNGSRPVEKEDHVVFAAEGDFEDAGSVVEDPENADDWRRIDGLAESFVVEADVAAGDRSAEGGASFGEAIDGFAELPHHFGFLRAAEIEAVRGGDRSRSARGHVAGGFGDRVHGAHARIQLAPTTLAIGREGEGALYGAGLRILDACHAGIARAGAGERIGANC